MMRKWLLSLGMGMLILSLAACGGGQNEGSNGDPTPDGDGTEFVLNTEHEAYAIYQANCISCHATDLSGQAGPQTNLQQVGDRLNAEQIQEVITNGRGMMPAQGHLSDEEIGLLADWLTSMN